MKTISVFSAKGAFVGHPPGKGKNSQFARAQRAAARKWKAQFKREGKAVQS